jgi:hypothetical protein
LLKTRTIPDLLISCNRRVPQQELNRRSEGQEILSQRTVPLLISSSPVTVGYSQQELATLDRVATVASYATSVAYPNTGPGQNVNGANGTYHNLMATLNDSLFAFHVDLKNQGLLDDTLLVSFSEFGRRITENGSGGTDHGAASVMLVMGGKVNGGLYGTAPSLNPDPQNATLENNAGDVHYETDVRSVYARISDNGLGVDSRAILNGDFRKSSLNFI